MTLRFTSLYEEHAPAVYRFALFLSGHASDADDVTAETFARAFTASGEIRTATVRAYLFTIARNVYLHGRRRVRRDAPLSETLPDPGRSPETDAASREALAGLLAALSQLGESDRAALLMRGQDDMSIDEIAAALGLSTAAVKVKIHRARLKLAALLDAKHEKELSHEQRHP